ncbi:unnamed protein product [Phytophthora lilii]|uniref:Unnamed protein product n=1 Tax=Phytophthora lilii TaxID=2077276 RepID=A0A9W6TQP9_9STRA|nr:unnamed protein product [Phytophthora lilii]
MKPLWTIFVVLVTTRAASLVESSTPTTTANDTAASSNNDISHDTSGEDTITKWGSTVRPDGSSTTWELTILASGGSILRESTQTIDGISVALERVTKPAPIATETAIVGAAKPAVGAPTFVTLSESTGCSRPDFHAYQSGYLYIDNRNNYPT